MFNGSVKSASIAWWNIMNLKNLLARKAELDKQIDSLSREQRGMAIAQVKALMGDHGLTLADLAGKSSSPGAKKSSAKGAKVAAKYRDPDSGTTWSGRGLKPKWLKAVIESGKKIEDFAI